MKGKKGFQKGELKGKTYEELWGKITADRLKKMRGDRKSFLGCHHTEKSKEKMRIASTGKKHTKETREKESKIAKEKGFGLWMIGKHDSEETKHKKSKTAKERGTGKWNKNRPLSEEHKANIGKNNAKYWKNKELPLEMRRQISATKQGISLNEWTHFKLSEPYSDEFDNKLKRLIRKRDNYECMNCGVHQEKLKYALSIHHINYDKNCNYLQNLVSLCRKCHGLTTKNREYWIKLFQTKLSKLFDYTYSLNGDIILTLDKSKI